ncbi:DeoR family transcriptional regulator, aga operon transcriptional repressor [Amycolatopsis xylanica]|uniref:DeoR family transcriptional regulator, aga operon transcriptional repressor n=1 Tax=Amycolatopsis xylanica TaxID=589385 RepID=A0A1H3N5P1_9PSEU|nr:DeoR/GlpR family DNA-binding transcription regulator [Amycolatopsis xylanica]SDY84271.1 DeoR family transcriptional regulator, aga operon transcriptional repressor [Amycolatopsis xylanica]
MDRHERLSALLDMVGQRDKIDVEKTAEELDVSPATIRRDLDHLAGRQLLTRTRGGAVASNVAYDLPLRHKAARHAPEKQRISAAAARMIERGMIVGLNGGTTTTEIGRAIATRADFNDRGSVSPALTVVTNALNIAHELAVRPNIKIVTTGGVARQHSFELTGPLAELLLNEITLDLVFLGVDAFDVTRGAYAHHEGEASINKLLAERARQVVVVTDSSKLGGQAFAQICPASAVDMLITDESADPDVLREFEEQGLAVVTA